MSELATAVFAAQSGSHLVDTPAQRTVCSVPA